MARPMIKEAGMASLLLENPYYILLLWQHILPSSVIIVYVTVVCCKMFMCVYRIVLIRWQVSKYLGKVLSNIRIVGLCGLSSLRDKIRNHEKCYFSNVDTFGFQQIISLSTGKLLSTTILYMEHIERLKFRITDAVLVKKVRVSNWCRHTNRVKIRIYCMCSTILRSARVFVACEHLLVLDSLFTWLP